MPATFSQLIDKMVAETKRPDLAVEISSYLNQTIRELHFEPERNNPVLFGENYREAQLTATSETGFQWTTPNPTIFQAPLAAQFASVWQDGEPVWAVPVMPGIGMRAQKYNYYRAGSTVVFSGYGGLNATINWSWYEYPKSLAYYPTGSRPALYSFVDQVWTYASAYDVDEETRAAARELTSNWLLMRWEEVITEGLRAKIYKRLSDDSRARTCYSLYQGLRKGLFMSETVDASGAI